MTAPLTVDEVLALPALVDVPTAGRALGVSRNTAYELARRNQFPVPVLPIGRQLRVTRAALLAALGISDPAADAA